MSAGTVLPTFNAGCYCVSPAGAGAVAGYFPDADLRFMGLVVFSANRPRSHSEHVARRAIPALYRFRK